MLPVSPPNDRCPVLSLADYVRRARVEKNLSLANVSARARGAIGKTHINRIENGTVTRVSISKLGALAIGLGVSLDEVLEVAQGKFRTVDSGANDVKLLSWFRQLSPDRQEDFLIMIRALAERPH
jgi:transcriptional regulator with XRE-family HTH domain